MRTPFRTATRSALFVGASIFASVGLYVGCSGALDEIVPKPDMAMKLDGGDGGGTGVDLGPATYVKDVDPVIQMSCAAAGAGCHGGTGSNMPSFIQNATGADLMTNYNTFIMNSNKAIPANSDMLTTPLNTDGTHGGATVFSSTMDPKYVAWLAFISDGEVFQ